MGDFQFNIAKGRIGELAALGAAADALIAVVLNSSGLESDATLKDYDTLSAILAASNDEHSNMARITMTGVTVTVNDTNDVTDVDAADLAWTAATGAATGKIIICYDGDTGAGTDANIIPLVGLDFAVTPNGGNITYQFPAADGGGGAGFFRSS